MKKIWNILLITLGLGILLLIGIMIFIGTVMGKKADKNYHYKNKIEIFSRDLYVYEFDSLKSKTAYELKIIDKDSIRLFLYENIKDSVKNMRFRFNKANSKLYFGSDQFKITKYKKHLTGIIFDEYELTEPIMDEIGSIYFNETYGVIAWDNNWGSQFYYINETNPNKIDLPIFKFNLE